MGQFFNVDTDAVVVHTAKLESLHRSAFPNAVRGTLNGLAFDVKKNTMPAEGSKVFVERQKNFLKANSRVDMAKGFNVDAMVSRVGFVSLGGSNRAVDELEQQEKGGAINNRSFVPMDPARTAKSPRRIVSRKNRIGGIRNVVQTKDVAGKNPGQKFVKAVLKAGIKGHVLTDKTLLRVDRIKRLKKGWKFKLTPLYSFEKGRKVKVKATHFMEKATEKTMKSADEIYFKEAERQFEKHLR